MNKQTKILIGVGVAAGLYWYFKKGPGSASAETPTEAIASAQNTATGIVDSLNSGNLFPNISF